MNKFHLHILALILMTLDHIGFILLPISSIEYSIMRLLGRLSFPLFAFLLAEGFHHTKSLKKYLFRILSVGIIIELCYFIISYTMKINTKESFNIMFTLVFGLISLICFKNKNIFIKILGLLPMIYIIYTTYYIPNIYFNGLRLYLNIEYGLYGYFMIVGFGLFKNKYIRSLILLLCIFLFTKGGILNTLGIRKALQHNYTYIAIFTIPLICLYNNKLGRKIPKYISYWYYPIHLVLLFGIKMLLEIL